MGYPLNLFIFGEFQVTDQLLHLVHHVVINFFTLVIYKILWSAVINGKQVLPEGSNHEEFLHHGIHVADAAQVAQTDVLLVPLLSRLGLVAPILRLLNCLNQGQELSLSRVVGGKEELFEI